MGSPIDLLQPGAAAGWLLLPCALVLCVLHGLEPGHSKTMMTAFIIAVRGTVSQAVLLGLAATVSHTSVVWVWPYGWEPAGLYRRRQSGFS
jgi:nickel/cobalt transporter (NicO) family protein